MYKSASLNQIDYLHFILMQSIKIMRTIVKFIIDTPRALRRAGLFTKYPLYEIINTHVVKWQVAGTIL